MVGIFVRLICDFTELNIRGYISMMTESVIKLLNSFDMPWFELKSKHFRFEV